MKLPLSIIIIASVILAACSKTADAPLATVPERLEISRAIASVSIGDTSIFTITYFNNLGQQQAVPGNIVWSSGNMLVATVANGVATGVGAGQTEIKAKFNGAISTALLTVVSNNTQLATVSITPTSIKEITLNQVATLTATAKNGNGEVIPGLTFSWLSDNTTMVTAGINGVVTGKAYGTANVTAEVNGIKSAPVMVQVIRLGSFAGSGSTGSAKLKIENGTLKIQTSGDFSTSTSPPDLRIYLGNNNGNVNNALEIGTLNLRNGAQSWNLPAGVTISEYRYALVWCKRLGGLYGVADLGN